MKEFETGGRTCGVLRMYGVPMYVNEKGRLRRSVILKSPSPGARHLGHLGHLDHDWALAMS